LNPIALIPASPEQQVNSGKIMNLGINYLTEKQLRKLPTPRLLALYRKRRRAVYSLDEGDRTDYGTYPEALQGDDGKILPEYLELYAYVDLIKSILGEREHVD
jgi:hypothetical protein